jgi:hypothetical protein
VATQGQNFRAIRSWDGSQARAFEELCYQLRDPTPSKASLWKLGNPDGGYEWFVQHQNGVQWGWQAKYAFDIDTLLKLMEASLKTVADKRAQCRRLTFCIPIDLPDSPDEGKRKSARQKFEDRKKSWRTRIPGAARIKNELWQAGDLLERLAKRERRGVAWFFWDEEIFNPDWCRTRLNVAIESAGKRYTPELNVELPIAFALEGLGRSDTFFDRYRARRGAFFKAVRQLVPARFTKLGVTNELHSVVSAVDACAAVFPRSLEGNCGFERSAMLAALDSTRAPLSAAYPDRSDNADERTRERIGHLRHHLGQASHRLNELRSFLNSPAARAAERGALVMTGGAGQGKTHLFCDAGQRCVDTDRPGVVLLGQHFAGRRVFTDIAERLGLPPRGATELLGAMRAAGEASGQPFVLLIDALNDSGEPQAWRDELPLLLAEVAQHAPWIVVGVSIRSSYLDLIASEALAALPRVEHPGFTGYEDEAAQRFFHSFGLEQPRIPLLLPEFTNPLFLRLYCEAIATSHITTVTAGYAHVTEVFEGYLQAKNDEISRALKLDPSDNKVSLAVSALADALAQVSREWLPRDEARAIIDSFAPHLQAWPDTLFGRLLAEGILTADVGYRPAEDGDWEMVPSVQITFQRLADYRIAASMVAPCTTASELTKMLQPGEPLRNRILHARAGVIEALAVLLPERFGLELLDATGWNLRDHRAERWYRATLASIAARRDDAATDRTIELLRRLSGRSMDLFEQASSVLIAVAPRPEHRLNGRFLHVALSRWSMPERDSAWGITTYNWMDQPGPLDRLIRWAAAGPYPSYDDRVIELAAIPLIWTLSSPNRVMRDYVTKALCQLLAPRLSVLEELLELFRTVNDPYVLQRLAVVTHGAVLVGGQAEPARALSCARLLASMVLGADAAPDVLARDGARGAMEWCYRAGLIEEAEYENAKPPYSSVPPGRPRTLKQLEKTYDRREATREAPGYISLFASVFAMGDFGRYVIESDVRHFTRYRLNARVPGKQRSRRPKLNKAKVAEFEKTLTAEELAAAQAGDWDTLRELLSPEQRQQLLDAFDPPPPLPSRAYPAELAQRWVFERVLSLGWTPERFARFDQNYSYDMGAGRSGHKPERFGKKYQWIAIHDLLARIADNFHMGEEWRDNTMAYQGPWQFLGRQIDPTLSPAKRVRDDDGVERLGQTFPPDRDDTWWIPPGPRYTDDQAPVQAGWAELPDDVPETRDLILRVDDAGAEWVALHAYYNWDEHPAEDRDRYESVRRDMWSHIYAWVVQVDDASRLFKYLNTRSLMGRWMPEGLEITDAAYIPEIPWAAAAREYPSAWESIRSRGDDDNPEIDVLPAWAGYTWEGNIWDCSIDDSVDAMAPAEQLFEAGGLRWVPTERRWADRSGAVVAEHHRTDDDRRSVLLVRRDWLRGILREHGWSLVVGRLGEKQLIGPGFTPSLLGGWSEINGTAMLHDDKWTFGSTRINVRHRHHG